MGAPLFIIYMDGAMGDCASQKRRSKLPTMIIQDRPHGNERQLLWGTVRKTTKKTTATRKGDNQYSKELRGDLRKSQKHDTGAEESQQEPRSRRPGKQTNENERTRCGNRNNKPKTVHTRPNLAARGRKNNPPQDIPLEATRRRQDDAEAQNRGKQDK